MKNKVLIAVLIPLCLPVTFLFSQNLGNPPLLNKGQELPYVKIRSRSFGLSVDRKNKQAVQKFYHDVYLPAATVKNEWSGSLQGCRPGTNSDSYQRATEQMINYFRAMAGLPADVFLDEELDQKAIHAALIFKAQKSLSHNPPKNWKCWTDTGYTAAGSSNIYYGSSGPPAIAGYIEDPGAGNYFVGHRRWILHPSQQVMGSGSTDESNALWVFGGFKKERPPTPDGVAWPPAGYVPYLFGLSDDYRWSFSYNNADFKKARVSVKYNNRNLRVRQEKTVNGYAENTLVWNVSGLPEGRPVDDVNAEVTIQNVNLNGKSVTLKYTVRFIDPGRGQSSGKENHNPGAGQELINAAFKGDVLKGEMALDSGADINTLHNGWTALMIASNYGKEDFVDFLLANKADVSIELNGTWTALRLAESRNHSSIAEKLKQAGASAVRSRSLNADHKIPALKR